ncbi:MAG: transposase [Pirellulales bacterium]|nr:transposase [Pirellulales bacterium]
MSFGGSSRSGRTRRSSHRTLGGSRLAAHQKKARRIGAAIAFIDEGGLLLTPVVQRTWAPRSQTPELIHRARHARKVSAIGAITVSPYQRRLGAYVKLYSDRSIRQEQVLQFVRQLRRHVRSPLIPVWDNLQAHRSKLIKQYTRKRGDVHLEFFPGYAPELNPVESLWSHTKCHRLANYCPDDVAELEDTAATKFSNTGMSLFLLKLLWWSHR